MANKNKENKRRHTQPHSKINLRKKKHQALPHTLLAFLSVSESARIHSKWIIACLSFWALDWRSHKLQIPRFKWAYEECVQRAICTLFEKCVNFIVYSIRSCDEHWIHRHLAQEWNSFIACVFMIICFQRLSSLKFGGEAILPRETKNHCVSSAWKCNYAIWGMAVGFGAISHLMWWRG